MLLGDQADALAKRIPTHNGRGPGQLDRWAQLEGRTDAWLHYQTQAANRKCIIFANSLLAYRPPTKMDLLFIDALFKYYDVYLWTDAGEKVFLTSPLANVHDFWDNRHLVSAINAQGVRHHLAEAGLAVDDFIILDNEIYHRIFIRLGQTNQLDGLLNLMQYNLNIIEQADLIFPALDPDATYEAELRSPTLAEITCLRQHLPKLKSLIIHDVSVNWIYNVLTKADTSGLGFVFIDIYAQQASEQALIFPELDIKDLILVSTHFITSLDLTKLRLRSLRIKPKHPIQVIKLGDVSNLEVLALTDVALEEVSAKFRQMGRLRSLRIHGYVYQDEQEQLPYLDLCSLPLLRNLSLSHVTLSNAPWPHKFPLLELIYLSADLKISESGIGLGQLKGLFQDSGRKVLDSEPELFMKLVLDPDCEAIMKGETTLYEVEEQNNPGLLSANALAIHNPTALSHQIILATANLGAVSNDALPHVLDYREFPDLEALMVSGGLNNSRGLKLTGFTGTLTQLEINAKQMSGKVELDFTGASDVLTCDLETQVCQTQGISSLAQLQRLVIAKQLFFDLVELPNPERLRHLEILGYDMSPWMLSHTDLAAFTSLEYFYGPCPRTITSLNSLQNLFANVSSEVRFENLPNLEILSIYLIDKVPITISNCPRLKYLSLCQQVIDCDEEFPITLEQNQSSYSALHTIRHWGKLPEKVYELVPENCVVIKVDALPVVNPSPPQNNYVDSLDDTETTFLSMDDDLGIDGNTGINHNEIYQTGDLKISIARKPPVNPHFLRYKSFAGWSLTSDDEIALNYTSEQDDLMKLDLPINEVVCLEEASAIIQRVRQTSGQAYVHIQGEVIPGQWLTIADIIPVNHPVDLLTLQALNKASLKVTPYYHKTWRQFYLHFDGERAAVIDIGVLLNEGSEITLTNFQDNLTTKALLDRRERNYVQAIIKRCPGLSFLEQARDAGRALETIKLLVNYFHDSEMGFINEPLHGLTGTKSSDIMAAVIEQKKGACRQRSIAFMILASYVGIRVAVAYNQIHAYCQIITERDEEPTIIRVDLGGAPAYYHTPRELLFDNLLAGPQASNESVPKNTDSIEHDDTLVTEYEAKFIKAAEGVIFDDLTTFIDSNYHNPLLYLDQDYLPMLIDNLAQKGQFLYIDNPTDMIKYLRPYQIHQGVQIMINGPLRDLIKHQGALVINWDNFSDQDIWRYQSLLDDEPNLMGNSVAKDLRIIGVTCIKRNFNEPFLSRVTRCKLRNVPVLNLDQTIPEQKWMTIDLKQSPAWRQLLFGRVEYPNDSTRQFDGPLPRALRANLSLQLTNPPRDPDFILLLQMIQQLQSFEYKEVLHRVPDDFKIKIETKEDDIRPAGVSVINLDELNEVTENPLHISANNFYDCISQLRMDKHSHALTRTRGLLDRSLSPGMFCAQQLVELARMTFSADKSGEKFFQGLRGLGRGLALLAYSGYRHIVRPFGLAKKMSPPPKLAPPNARPLVCYIHGYISYSQWQLLMRHIANYYQDYKFAFTYKIRAYSLSVSVTVPMDKQFIFVLMPGAEIERVAKNEAVPTPPVTIIKTNNPQYYCEQQTHVIVVKVNLDTKFSDLIEQKYCEETEGKLRYYSRTHAIMGELIAGKTVILCGDITTELYQQLQSLLSDYKYCYVNGKRVNIKGTLQLVLPRHSPHPAHHEVYAQPGQAIRVLKDDDWLTVNLQQSPAWRELLFGNIKYTGNAIELAGGPLPTAIRKNKPLKIINPPDDKAFSLLLLQIKHMHKFMYNGVMQTVPDGFMLEIEHKTQAFTNQPSNVYIVNEAEFTPGNAKPIYLHINNIHECESQLQIDRMTHTANDGAGYLQQASKQAVFYISGYISYGQWQHLMTYITTHYPDKAFTFVLKAGAEIEKGAKNDAVPTAPDTIIKTNDPDYYCAQQEGVAVVHVSENTQYSDLIESQFFEQKDGKVRYYSIIQGVLAQLSAGRTVILCGDISSELYQQLASLLHNHKCCYVNGERIEIQGALKIVLPMGSIHPAHQTIQYSLEDYLLALNVSPEMSVKLKQFYQFLQHVQHSGQGIPTKPALSYQLLSRMIARLNSPIGHDENPIKGLMLYDYPKDSEVYAKINVVAKMLFSQQFEPQFNARKFIAIKTAQGESNIFVTCPWQVLNCMNGAMLRKVLADDFDAIINGEISQPIITPTIFDELETITKEQQHVTKCQQQLQALLEDGDTQIIFLKGLPGVRKTHTMRNIVSQRKDIKLFDGVSSIKSCLETETERLMLLLLDEANFAKPGTWAFLKALCRPGESLYYQGKFYDKAKLNIKVVCTGNPESLPGRYYHDIIRHYAETIYFQSPTDSFFINAILLPILAELNQIGEQHYQQMLQVYHCVNEFNPYLWLSIRDVQNLAHRLTVIFDKGVSVEVNIARACVGEFAPAIRHPKRRVDFINKVYGICGLSPPEPEKNSLMTVFGNKKVTVQKRYVIDAIEQHLMLCERGRGDYKRGLIIEGESGLGKSTLVELVLQKHGFSKDALDPKKRYYKLTNGTKDARQILLKTFHQGSKIILDEFSVDDSLEALLTQYLSGTDENGKPAAQSGFMLFCTQNLSSSTGLKAQSSAVQNRVTMVYMDSYAEPEVECLAEGLGISAAHACARGFFSAKAKAPQAVNMRTFFKARKLQ